MDIKVTHSSNVYSGKIFSIKQDSVLFPNGHEAKLDIIHHPGAVVIVPLDESGNIWFIEQYRHAAGKVLLEVPAGTLETGENPEKCALRELREEIGMAASSFLNIGGFFTTPGYTTEYLHIFLAEGLFPEPLQGDLDEMIKINKLPAASAYQLAETGQIHDGKTLAALLLAKQHINFS